MDDTFSIIEAVKARRSVRTYDGLPLSDDMRQRLERFAAEIGNPFGAKVRLPIVNKRAGANGEKLGTYGTIKGAETFIGAVAEKSELAALGVGYQMEHLVLYATSLGLGTVWLAATFTRDKFERAMDIKPDELLPAVSPVGRPAAPRFAEKVMRMAAGANSRKPWTKLFCDGSPAKPLTESEAGAYAVPLEMLRLAPSSTNSQPWRVVKDGDSWHFYTECKPSNAMIKEVDLGIGICHFALTAGELGLKGQFTFVRPAIDAPAEWAYKATWQAL